MNLVWAIEVSDSRLPNENLHIVISQDIEKNNNKPSGIFVCQHKVYYYLFVNRLQGCMTLHLNEE